MIFFVVEVAYSSASPALFPETDSDPSKTVGLSSSQNRSWKESRRKFPSPNRYQAESDEWKRSLVLPPTPLLQDDTTTLEGILPQLLVLRQPLRLPLTSPVSLITACADVVFPPSPTSKFVASFQEFPLIKRCSQVVHKGKADGAL